MSSLPVPPNSCLLAILLLTKYQYDPQIVFHYPPRPGEDDSKLHKYLRDFEGAESSSSNEDSTTSADDQDVEANSGVKPNKIQPHDLEVDETGSASPDKRNGIETPREHSNWGEIFGHNPHFLAKLLCPAKSGHKKRFEVSVNDKVFLGRPAFANEDGEWRKRKRKTGGGNDERQGDPESIQMPVKTSVQTTQDLSETSGLGSDSDNQEDGISNETLTIKQPAKDKANELQQRAKHRKIRRKDNLSMFQVVFIMAPPPLEYQLRVGEMYDYVVKKFSRALKWEQARSSLVSREGLMLARLTNSFGGRLSGILVGTLVKLACLTLLGPNPPLASLYHELLKNSNVARAIANVYSSISNCRIAQISLTPDLSLSLKIPVPTSTAVLPNLISHQLPGLWLTTATSIPLEDGAHFSSSQLASHFALLLLSDLPSILADVQSTDSPLAEHLADYLNVSKPTKSFLQISQSSGIALSDIQHIASHLIYWRRAAAIPPLHQRDIYIMSPNADMSKLASASAHFAKLYPALPPLPKILSLLSSTPRPYSTLIPSKDHKEAYMGILAWLFRYGWVTQLRTFAWIRVPPHILKSVAGGPAHGRNGSKESDPSTSDNATHLHVPNLASSPSSSTQSSTHTAVPISSSSPPTSPILVPRPLHPTTAASAYLAAMSAHVLFTQGEEARDGWEKCVKYFDGKHALETIAIREGWKRKKVGDLVAGWEGMGFLRRVRHW
ncbi:MAG: Nitrogen permease regulator 3 [Heterodermia speciosa]|uniref:Nitrogen permease regulator 3 n=1 Tax=Heterodermia speciosa TaxID=116794 RepID=A0A8H3G497_9LECA|nr:MAG: Nitrogen permease regulator 3 [Heterodermia speciosa]